MPRGAVSGRVAASGRIAVASRIPEGFGQTIEVVNFKTVQANGLSTGLITFPNGTAVGDVVYFYLRGLNSIASGVSAWTNVQTNRIYSKPIEPGDAGLALTFSGSSAAYAIVMVTYRGIKLSSYQGAIAGTTSAFSGTTITTNTLTSTTERALPIANASVANSSGSPSWSSVSSRWQMIAVASQGVYSVAVARYKEPLPIRTRGSLGATFTLSTTITSSAESRVLHLTPNGV